MRPVATSKIEWGREKDRVNRRRRRKNPILTSTKPPPPLKKNIHFDAVSSTTGASETKQTERKRANRNEMQKKKDRKDYNLRTKLKHTRPPLLSPPPPSPNKHTDNTDTAIWRVYSNNHHWQSVIYSNIFTAENNIMAIRVNRKIQEDQSDCLRHVLCLEIPKKRKL